jgi:hypothetical protein
VATNRKPNRTAGACTKRRITAVSRQPISVPTRRSARRWRVMLKLGLRMTAMVSAIQ